MAKQNDEAILYTVRWLNERDPEIGARVAEHLHRSLVQDTRPSVSDREVVEAATPWAQTADIVRALGLEECRASSRRVTDALTAAGWENVTIRPKGELARRAWRPKGWTMEDYPMRLRADPERG